MGLRVAGALALTLVCTALAPRSSPASRLDERPAAELRGSYRGTVGRYTWWPFGFFIAQPSACVPLEVWLDDQPTPIRQVVPIGRDAC